MDTVVRFKTTINCKNCLAKVTPLLNASQEISEWKVDLDDPDRILTAHLKNNDVSEVRKAVEQAGFRIEEIR